MLNLRAVLCQKENGQGTGTGVKTLRYIPFPVLVYQSLHLMIRKLWCYECSKVHQITLSRVRYILSVNYAAISHSPQESGEISS